MVVSEIGELWSPNSPPESTAPMHTYRGALTATVAGMTKGNIIAKVPQEEPIAKLIIAASRKTTAANNQPGTAACATLET